MERFLKPLLCAAVAIIGAGAGQCFAEQEVGNIWWSLYDDYNGSNQSACVAENYNDHAVDALFEVSPTSYDFDGNPVPGRMLVTMAPYQTYKVFSRANATGPGPRCNNFSLTSAAPTPSPLMGEGWGGGENLLRFSVFPPP